MKNWFDNYITRVKNKLIAILAPARTLTIVKVSLKDILNDPEADIGTGLAVISPSGGYYFTVKSPERWRGSEIPFGGIGGKLEPGENLSQSLKREVLEEVGVEFKVRSSDEQTIFIQGNEIKYVQVTESEGEPIPLIIFKSPRAEQGRKPFTYVLIYTGEFGSLDIKPLDDPAILEINEPLLMEMYTRMISVKEFMERGGKLSSRIDLPNEYILRPVGTAIALARCISKNIKPNHLPRSGES